MVTRGMMEKAWDTLVKRVENELIPAALELKKAHDAIAPKERLQFMHEAMKRNGDIVGIKYPTKILVCGDDDSYVIIGERNLYYVLNYTARLVFYPRFGYALPISNLWHLIDERDSSIKIARHLCGLYYPHSGSILTCNDDWSDFHCNDDSEVHNALVKGMINLNAQMSFIGYLSCEGIKTFASEVETLYNKIVAADDDDTKRFVEMFGISDSNRKQISITVTITEK